MKWTEIENLIRKGDLVKTNGFLVRNQGAASIRLWTSGGVSYYNFLGGSWNCNCTYWSRVSSATY